MQRGFFKSKKSQVFLRQNKNEPRHKESVNNASMATYCQNSGCCHPSSKYFHDSSLQARSSPTTSENFNKVATLATASELSRTTSWSSSYTSWTRPAGGKWNTDSSGPASDILDDGNIDQDIFIQRRRSSADTCKDIDDIDDFELDPLNDCDTPDDKEILTKDVQTELGLSKAISIKK